MDSHIFEFMHFDDIMLLGKITAVYLQQTESLQSISA